jgi:hypothetical protein
MVLVIIYIKPQRVRVYRVIILFLGGAKKKYMCVYCHMSKKSRVGRSGLIFFIIIDKTGNSRSRFRYLIF